MRRFAMLVAGSSLALALVGCAGGDDGAVITTTTSETTTGSRWMITDLGTLGGRESTALAINDRGQIVGSSFISRIDSNHAFLWVTGKMTDLGVLHPRWESEAVDINEHGQIIGSSWTGNSDGYSVGFRSLLWERGTMRTLPSRGSPNQASAINDRGQIVGWTDTRRRGDQRGYAVPHAVLWQAGTVRDLGTVHGWEASSEAKAINGHAQVTGTMNATGLGGDDRAFVWQNGSTHDLGTLGQWWSSGPSAINDKGLIVGEWNGHATLWVKGVPHRLDGAGEESEAVDINDKGQIVGWWSRAKDDVAHAALWENGKLTLLPGLPGVRGAATALGISEHGQIVGWSDTKVGVPHNPHAVLWTPKP